MAKKKKKPPAKKNKGAIKAGAKKKPRAKKNKGAVKAKAKSLAAKALAKIKANKAAAKAEAITKSVTKKPSARAPDMIVTNPTTPLREEQEKQEHCEGEGAGALPKRRLLKKSSPTKSTPVKNNKLNLPESWKSVKTTETRGDWTKLTFKERGGRLYYKYARLSDMKRFESLKKARPPGTLVAQSSEISVGVVGRHLCD